MILIDTNILIEIYRNNIPIIEAVKLIGQNKLAVSDITCAELYFGARYKKELHAIAKDMKKLQVLNIQSEVSSKAVELVAKYALSHKLAIPDALIAATSICNNLPLYTLNLKDFIYIDGLKLYK
jgi:predicted nucleic acid-binding protein